MPPRWHRLSEIATCRRILFAMLTSGFIVNTFVKAIFNIAIVAMVAKDQPNTFDWTEGQKQEILGIFFWGFAITKFPSGRLAEIIGSRKVTGYSMAVASVLTVLTPLIASFNYYALLVSRIVMGFVIGASWPALMPLVSNWIGPTEHSMFMTALASTSIGFGLSSLVGGVLIANYGWPSIFYTAGSVALLWTILWFYFIYDSPRQHPRISLEEREDIESKIKKDFGKIKLKFNDIPWRKIFVSGPVWGIAIAQMASFFTTMTITTELPSYLDQVLHYDISENGVMASLPTWGVYVTSLGSAYIADRLLQTNTLSTTTVRKTFGTTAFLIPSIFMVILAFYGDVATIVLVSFCISLAINAFAVAGHCANMLDISPNFSGTICGLVNTVAAITVYFSTRIVGLLIRNGHTYENWRPLFWILAAVYGFGAVSYFVLCSGKVQSWDLREPEREPLKKDNRGESP
ncbi:Putative inorganic phosphate cotransporter-like Protein [Tribolium castaneum]|uniref:Inorganic phosphate cotransporter-like Protein n=1 Tax=Tribolium castaneum TaxID=7070 RepID=D2A1M4_TRICA|nr:PREDICTED: sialin [Tribolium castaneum]EFA02693.1 Putative inorganic phosphate cotransporter-like Protein [Tribolium castaneum]|eukprot:XP_970588.1 PREDICTED: sialin [Tribolium castaneum]